MKLRNILSYETFVSKLFLDVI